MAVTNPVGKFIPVSQRLSKDGLALLPLNALVDDGEKYSLLILQPNEKLVAAPTAIKSANQTSSSGKFSQFLTIAKSTQPDIAVCPEYFGNWDAFINALNGKQFPTQGKLWILGMESITPADLATLAQRCQSVAWLIDDFTEVSHGAFLDAAVFAFWGKNAQGELRQICLLQFKTQPMVDPNDHFENTYMHRGKYIYLFSNNANSISLGCLICSDSLTFHYEDLPPGFHHVPYLLIHIQANTDPIHTLYKEYRAHALQYRWPLEIICANWAAGFEIDQVCTGSHYGDTCLFTKSTEVTLSDHVINANHGYGLYYSYCHPMRTHKYFFNYREHIFHFETTKVSQQAMPAALHGRVGPAALRAYIWKTTGTWEPEIAVNDGFAEECAQYAEDIAPLMDATISAIDKERFLVLSCGRASRAGWHVPRSLYTCIVLEDEKPRRVTVCFPKDADVLQRRTQIVQQFCELKNSIMATPANVPETLSDLKNDNMFTYSSSSNKQHINVVRKDGRGAATVAFLGASTDENAQMTFDDLSMLSGTQSRRVVVWYKVGTSLREKHSPPPIIIDNSSSGPTDLNREG